ncbi:magnesium and cobalt transport protein CorA [Fictibacillus arsenicus]|uniref:Magnesium transport protein CorA n=1 Tax=Fictibacillus arsenicus TaxID=255247 RepID=A0A1B1Z1R9_9BACL|nr:magnesium/cobalt transporter CorA [Fictibacillus arsenicus]ANX11259.1 magnesium and cobalt transport protein CorA [Fictibacillus arsenicus]
MIRTLAVVDQKVIINPPLERLDEIQADWVWVDFDSPIKKETNLLRSFFDFHPLAVEDCVNNLQRPKVEFYEEHLFYVVHALDEKTLEATEVDFFTTKNMVVTFHKTEVPEIDFVWNYLRGLKSVPPELGKNELIHKLMDKLVDMYFPIMHKLEERVISIESNEDDEAPKLINQIFDIRADLLSLRKTVVPMRELLYRMLESKRVGLDADERSYFHDIYDHLLRLTDMMTSAREMTSDIRDNYISLNSYRMNNIMKTLTVITTIFMPLTFIAGLYGMNFVNMPELKSENGYFYVLGIMILLGVMMSLWFKKKGWFEQD